MSSMPRHRVPSTLSVLAGVWAWLQLHRTARWLLIGLGVFSVCLLAAAPSWAAGHPNPLMLPSDGLTDSHGVPIQRYISPPIDPGNPPNYVLRKARFVIVSIAWAIYALPAMLVIIVVNWILKFEWLSWLATPLGAAADGVGSVLGGSTGTAGLITLGCLASALVIAFGYLRGRMAAATVELAMVIMVFGLVTSSVLAPFSWLDGEGGDKGGLIQEAADTGAEVGALTVNEGEEQDTLTLASSLVDVTLRDPMLTLSFGSPLEDDLANCGEQFTDKAKDASNDEESIRKSVIKCDDGVAAANQTDGYTWLAQYVMFWPASLGVMGLIGVFLFFLVKETVQALISAVMVTIRAFFATFPGGSRQAFLNAIAQLFVSVIIIGVYVWALMVYIWAVSEIFTEYIPAGLMRIGSIIIGIAMIFAAYTFWKMKKQGKSVGERIARALGRTGLSKDFAEKEPSKFGATAGNLAKGALSKGLDMYNNSRLLRGAVTAASAAGTAGVGAAAVNAAGAGLAGKAASSTASRVASRAALPPAAGAASPPALPPAAGAAESPATPLPSAPLAPAGGGELPPASNPQAGHEVGPAPAPPAPPKQPDQSTSHIPAGRYGKTWVHRNGQVSTPITVTPDGSRVTTVPSDQQMRRGWKSGDSFVVTDATVRPKPSPMKARQHQYPGGAVRGGD